MRLTAKVAGMHRWAVHSRAPFGSCLQSPHIGCNPNPTGRTDHRSSVAHDSVQASVQQSTEGYRRYVALENTVWNYHPAFFFDAGVICEKCCTVEFYLFKIIYFIITWQLLELHCSILTEK